MLKKKSFIYFTIIFLFLNNISFSLENKILLKIENEIITSIDVNNEYKYLIALNPNIKDSKEEDIKRLAQKSIIQEKIKKIEINKNFNNPKIPSKILEEILKNVYTRIGIENLEKFKEYLTINNINFEDVQNKLEIEALWNELVIIKYSSRVKINEEKLKKKLQKNSNRSLKSYSLSEIAFEIKNVKELNDKFIEISNTINSKGFEFAVLEHSISSTTNFGGKLDWINENTLNKNIREALKNLKINQFTNPIAVPGGFLILKIDDVKNIKIKINIDKELKKLVNYERNNQLNQYSKIYFNRIKKNLITNES